MAVQYRQYCTVPGVSLDLTLMVAPQRLIGLTELDWVCVRYGRWDPVSCFTSARHIGSRRWKARSLHEHDRMAGFSALDGGAAHDALDIHDNGGDDEERGNELERKVEEQCVGVK